MAAPHELRPTLRQIAQRARVSVMTVSYSFNEPDRVSRATRERVLAVAAELGYQGKNPWATALRRGRAGALGVVFREHLTYAFTTRRRQTSSPVWRRSARRRAWA